MESSGWALIQYPLVRGWNSDTLRETPEECIELGMTMQGHREKAPICKPKKGDSGETKSVNNLILDFHPPER